MIAPGIFQTFETFCKKRLLLWLIGDKITDSLAFQWSHQIDSTSVVIKTLLMHILYEGQKHNEYFM